MGYVYGPYDLPIEQINNTSLVPSAATGSEMAALPLMLAIACNRGLSGVGASRRYVNSLRHLGFGDEDFSGGGSDRLVDAIVVWGDEQAIVGRVLELRERGADHVVMHPLADDLAGVIDQLERLAPALSSLGVLGLREDQPPKESL